jgi:rare lipoprotein A
MLAMTAAHKTLPLPTYVEVTNLSNQRKVIVKVNDRGPFESNRLIDLSYVAAKKLGMIGHGTARVRVKAINPYTYGQHFNFVKKWSPGTSAQIVYFQVGVFRNKTHAARLKQKLTSLLKAPVSISRTQTKLYRVQVGPIKDLTAADKINIRLKDLGIKSNKQRGV